MIPTARLAELADLADLRGWRIALIGDPLQSSAVGRGGMFGLLVDTFDAVELDRVHRFDQPWERDASLALRHGDLDVTDVYHDHGRLHGGTPDAMERAAVAAWWSQRHTGETVALLAPTTEAVDRLNTRAQQHRLRAGEVDPHGPSIPIGSTSLYVGDEIVTRRNDRHLVTDQGELVRNRAQWAIDSIHFDGSLAATGRHGTIHLPARYVADHVELGYATTGAAAQGRTVDHALVVIGRPCDVRNLYVATSRGTQSNHAYLATPGETTAHDVFTQCLIADWIDQPAHTRQAELRGEPPHRAGLLDGAMLRDLLERRHQLADELQRAEARQQRLPGELRQAEAAKTAAEETIAGLQAEQRRLEGVIADYDRPLRRHLHQDQIVAAHQHLAHIPYRLDTARDELASAMDTVARLNAGAIENRVVLARRGDIEAEIADLDYEITDDRHRRTRVARRERPEAIITVLGPRPRHGHDAQSGDTVAGRLAQHQAAFNINDGLGPRPDYYHRLPYLESHQAIAAFLQPLDRPVLYHAIELPDLGLSL